MWNVQARTSQTVQGKHDDSTLESSCHLGDNGPAQKRGNPKCVHIEALDDQTWSW
jgi:hypothetical protein